MFIYNSFNHTSQCFVSTDWVKYTKLMLCPRVIRHEQFSLSRICIDAPPITTLSLKKPYKHISMMQWSTHSYQKPYPQVYRPMYFSCNILNYIKVKIKILHKICIINIVITNCLIHIFSMRRDKPPTKLFRYERF